MARLSVAALLLSIVAAGAQPRPNLTEWQEQQEAAKAEEKAVVARQKKTAAVQKVVKMLEGVQAKVLAEGEAEAKTYDKFACLCKDTTKEKVEAIQRGEDDAAALSAAIEELASQRDGHDTKIQESQDAIAALEKARAEADAARAGTKKEYDANAADLQAALEALTGALKTLKVSKTAPSFAQLSGVSATLRAAVGLADALGLSGAEAAGRAVALLQQPANEVQMQDYDFHSDGIVATLEKLQEDFRKTKVDVDKAEVASVAEHDEFAQTNTHEIKMQNEAIAKAKKAREQAIVEIQENSEQLSTVKSVLMQDKEYTNELSEMCSDKARTWDQRSRVRSDELATLTQAIGIVKGAVAEKTTAATIRFAQQGVSVRLAKAVALSPSSMEAIEAAAEDADAAPAFVQVQAHVAAPTDGRQAVVDLLTAQGRSIRSTLLMALASKIAADPFAKVKVLIQELIERLLQEAANEANHKGWCDKAMADAKQKRDYAAEEIATLNEEMAELEARRDSLSEALAELEKEISELTEARAKAETERSEEKAENAATVEEAQAGLDALSMCIDILDKFYKTVKKETVELSLAQGPQDDAPDAGFDNGEAYLGAQAESGGILGMLDVMKSDFVRTIEETQAAEAQAEKDHLAFMTETGKSLAVAEEAHTQRKAQFEDADEKHGEAEANLDEQSGILRTSLKELLELKPACIDTGMSYEDRVAMREEEIAALKKAMCILGKYAEYGPEGAADGC